MLTAVLAAVLVVVVLIAGVALWAMRANGDVARSAKAARAAGGIDPFAVNEPWRRFVQDALQARAQFVEVVATAKPGPLRDRLSEIGTTLDQGVQRAWSTAQQGQKLREARRRIDTNVIAQRLSQLADAPPSDAEPGDAALAELAQADQSRLTSSLQAQLASAQRLDAITDAAQTQLQLLQVQLDEAVARAAELSVRAGDVGELARVQEDITQVAEHLEALRLALEETGA